MIKITIKKDKTIKWWVEGYENKEIKDSDIDTIEDIIDIVKVDIIEKMRDRQKIERSNKGKVKVFKLKE